VQSHTIWKGTWDDTVDVYSYQNCPPTELNTIAAPSAVHQQLFGHWEIFLDTLVSFNGHSYPSWIAHFKNFDLVDISNGDAVYNLRYSLHEQQGVKWLQLYPIPDPEAPWRVNNEFGRLKRLFPIRLFIQHIESNTILISRIAKKRNKINSMVRAKGIVQENINYQELIEGREFHYTEYGYMGCPDTYSPVWALDRIIVFFIDSSKLVSAYKSDYGRIRIPLRFSEPAVRSSEVGITVVGSTIYHKDEKSDRSWPWFEIVVRTGIHEIEVELYDLIEFATLLEINTDSD
jgi:hypothetical protein